MMSRLTPVMCVTLFFLSTNAFAQNMASNETSVPGGVLMLASYIGFFALLLGYLAILSRRQSAIEDDLETLQKRLDSIAGVEE